MSAHTAATPQGNEGSDLSNKVNEWINTEGYGLEFRTHSALLANGLRSSMGFYVTVDGGPPSEIDVIADKATEFDGKAGSYAFVRLLCECKYSDSHPWILFSTGNSGFSPLDWISIPKSEDMLAFFANRRHLSKQFFAAPYFTARMPIGHNIVPAFRQPKDRDDAYKALKKVAIAAWHLAESESAKKVRYSSIVIPCIVVDAKMFLATFDASRSCMTAEPLMFGRVRWQGSGRLTYIDVVSAQSLGPYASMMSQSFNTMYKTMAQGLQIKASASADD